MQYSWMEIDLEAVADNFKSIRNQISVDTEIMAVVKADAYGLGCVPISKKLEAAGCKHFAVTFFEEGVELRNAGIQSDILVMMPVEPEEAVQASDLNLTVAMGDIAHAERVSEMLVAETKKLRMHVKVDTGLSRMGIVVRERLDDAVADAKHLSSLPGFETEGVFTHITSAGPSGNYPKLDDEELNLFEEFTAALSVSGLNLKKHSLCSEPILYRNAGKSDYLRIGTLLYGVNPAKYEQYGVRSCLNLKSKIVQVKEIPANTPVSYGPLYVTDKPTRIAVVAIGFADGIRRALSNIGEMIVRGKKVRIIGKICCDHTILDVTDMPEVTEGDIVTIFGRDGEAEQYAGDFARLCKASEPETTSILSSRIPRSYLNQ